MAEHHGIKINAQMEKIDGRVLPAPKLDYSSRGKASTVEPRQGSWDTRDHQFLKGATINNWVILNTARCDDRQIQQFADGLCKSAHFNGVKMTKPQKIFHTRGNADLETKVKYTLNFNVYILTPPTSRDVGVSIDNMNLYFVILKPEQ